VCVFSSYTLIFVWCKKQRFNFRCWVRSTINSRLLDLLELHAYIIVQVFPTRSLSLHIILLHCICALIYFVAHHSTTLALARSSYTCRIWRQNRWEQKLHQWMIPSRYESRILSICFCVKIFTLYSDSKRLWLFSGMHKFVSWVEIVQSFKN
jgi:hypothetical protein